MKLNVTLAEGVCYLGPIFRSVKTAQIPAYFLYSHYGLLSSIFIMGGLCLETQSALFVKLSLLICMMLTCTWQGHQSALQLSISNKTPVISWTRWAILKPEEGCERKALWKRLQNTIQLLVCFFIILTVSLFIEREFFPSLSWEWFYWKHQNEEDGCIISAVPGVRIFDWFGVMCTYKISLSAYSLPFI